MENKWAIILGCSTGHGAATAKQLATEGYGIIGFHLDRGSIKKDALKLEHQIASLNDNRVKFWNENAADKKIMSAKICLLYTSPSPRDKHRSRMPSSA